MQPPHHEAQKLSSQTLPLRSFDEITFPGSWSWGREKSGAAFPTKGDGISRGLSVSPTARNPTTTIKMPERDEKPAHDTVWRAICVGAGTAASFRRHASRYRRSLMARTPPNAMIKQPPQIQSMKGL